MDFTQVRSVCKCLFVKIPENNLLKVPTLACDLSAEEKANLLITVNSMCQRFFRRDFGKTKQGWGPSGDHDRIALNACPHFQIIIQDSQSGYPPTDFLIYDGIEIQNPGPVIGKKLEELESCNHMESDVLHKVEACVGWTASHPGALHPSPNFQGWITPADLQA